MPDDRYLDGDPAAPSGLFTDLSPFVQATQQECRLIVDLIRAGRLVEAEDVAIGRQIRAESILHSLEVPTLPEVDVSATLEAADRRFWKYR